MFNSRKYFIFISFLIIFFLLAGRMFYFQIYDGNNLAKAASAQRQINSTVEKTRGNIFDRNGIPFTYRSKKVLIVIKTLLLRGQDTEIKKISAMLNLNPYKLKREIDVKKNPIIVETEESNGKQIAAAGIKGVSVIHTLQRYDGNSIAKHIAGYLNRVDQTGEAGIEKFYEKELKSGIESSISVIKDATNNPLQGLGYRLIKDKAENERLNVKLTLDYHIQKIVEEVMEKNAVRGAVVVEDVNTGDIMAIASKPDFDQNRVDKFLESPQKELFNKAVASYNMGSIFKIIDAAQALEAHQEINSEFFCNGYIEIGDKILKCTSYNKGGHGKVDFTRAFALSCNPYFIDLGIKSGYRNIIDMAKKFGLGSATGVKNQGVNESSGSLPDPSEYFTDGDTANMSIGQGKVMVTPVQVADIVATVANGGMKNSINIVDSIIDDDGNTVRKARRNSGQRIISKETSDKIKSMMEEVVTSGTGKRADLEKYGGSGGKTGSAETGLSIDSSTNVVQAWFAGYFPRKNPKYSIAVFIENGRVGGEVAAPIFEQIAEEIMKKGY